MTETENIYRSILLKISAIPASYLNHVDDYLQKLNSKIEIERDENRKKILAFTGEWEDMSDADFDKYLKAAKEAGQRQRC